MVIILFWSGPHVKHCWMVACYGKRKDLKFYFSESRENEQPDDAKWGVSRVHHGLSEGLGESVSHFTRLVSLNSWLFLTNGNLVQGDFDKEAS